MDEYVKILDSKRADENLLKISELDKTTFRAKTHMTGENASSLIYACSLNDFISININKYDIVAICGNSMGWYIALALSGAMSYENAYQLIHTMGTMMTEGIIGGQIIYPIVDKNWQLDAEKSAMVLAEIEKTGAYVSIYLGGYLVIGGEQTVLDKLLKKLPTDDTYPCLLYTSDADDE